MSADAELEVLLSLDGQSYEAAAGYVVEFIVRRTEKTKARPHGISYALVFRAKDGEPYVRFDNATRWNDAGQDSRSGRRPTTIGTGRKRIAGGRAPLPRRRGFSTTSGAR
ncbi:MAG: hypothetical protein ACJ8FM_06840 [Xanthobacteraceae bacterium]